MREIDSIESDFGDTADLVTYEADFTGAELFRWWKRAPRMKGILLPTVRSTREANHIENSFKAVLTAGPSAASWPWRHKNQRLWSFYNSWDPDGPSVEQVEEMLWFGLDQDDLLVHCYDGISQSTAIAWGIAIARGLDPAETFEVLSVAQPLVRDESEQRLFVPMTELLEHIQTVTGQKDLFEIRAEFLKDVPGAWELL